MKKIVGVFCVSLVSCLSTCVYGGLFDSVVKAAGEAVNVVNGVGTGSKSDQSQIEKANEEERARREAYAKEQEQKEAERQERIKKANEEERARREAYQKEREKEEAERRAKLKKEQEAQEAKRAQERAESEKRQAEARREEMNERRKDARQGLWRDATAILWENSRRNHYVIPSDFEGDIQYPIVEGVTFARAPLYKDITSGSALTWALVKLGDNQSLNIEMKPYKTTDIECKTFTAEIKKDLKFLCIIPGSEKYEDVMDRYGKSKNGFYCGGFTKPEQVPDIVVIGFQKKFPPSVSAEDALGSIQKKYQGLKILKATEIDSMVNATTMGLVIKEKRNLIKFSNEDICGFVSQTDLEFAELPDDSDAVYFFVYLTAINGGMGGSMKREFEKSFKAGQAKYQALCDEGKLTKEIEKFGWRLGSKGNVEMNQTLFYITSMAAKHAITENSFLCKREIEEARDQIKSLKARLKQMIANGEFETTSNISLQVYDKKAIVDLPKLEKKAADKKAKEVKAAEDKAKQEALDF